MGLDESIKYFNVEKEAEKIKKYYELLSKKRDYSDKIRKYILENEDAISKTNASVGLFIDMLKKLKETAGSSSDNSSLYQIRNDFIADLINNRNNKEWIKKQIQGKERRIKKYLSEGINGKQISPNSGIIETINREIDYLKTKDFQKLLNDMYSDAGISNDYMYYSPVP